MSAETFAALDEAIRAQRHLYTPDGFYGPPQRYWLGATTHHEIAWDEAEQDTE